MLTASNPAIFFVLACERPLRLARREDGFLLLTGDEYFSYSTLDLTAFSSP
jgi:hypothetical protein